MTELDSLVRLGQLLDEKPESTLMISAKLLKVRDRQGFLRPLAPNAAQREFERRRGRQNIVLKARQMGITTWVAARFFLRTISRPGTLTLQVAHTREAAEGIFQTVQRMWEELPEDLREGPLRLRRSNAGQMVFGKIDSEFRIASASDTNAGRGLSVQNLHCSEVARWPGPAAETLAGLRAALAPDGEMVLESTPRGAYGAFYEEWCSATDREPLEECGAAGQSDPPMRAESAGLVRHFLPWWLESAYVSAAADGEQLREDERELVMRQGLSLQQIGFRRTLERSYGALRSQEFAEDAETCFRATGECCFEVSAIEGRIGELPRELERRRGGALLIWLPPQNGREYVVAVDSAGGGEDGDFAAVQVVEITTGLQCAELQQKLRPAELAKAAAELAREYGGALVAVERNNHGAAVLAYLETREGYGRLYRQRGEAGWLTSAGSKPEMIAGLGVLLAESPERFMSRRLLGECRSFVSGEGGRSGAANGAHDDLVMSMAIAQAVRVEHVRR